MTTKKDKAEARDRALAFFNAPNAPRTIYTQVTHVSRSGMCRRVKCYAIVDGEISDVTWYVAHASGQKLHHKAWHEIVVGGCGFNVCLQVVDTLNWALFKGARRLQQGNYSFASKGETRPVGLIWRDM